MDSQRGCTPYAFIVNCRLLLVGEEVTDVEPVDDEGEHGQDDSLFFDSSVGVTAIIICFNFHTCSTNIHCQVYHSIAPSA